jgi:hypothetical protein
MGQVAKSSLVKYKFIVILSQLVDETLVAISIQRLLKVDDDW